MTEAMIHHAKTKHPLYVETLNNASTELLKNEIKQLTYGNIRHNYPGECRDKRLLIDNEIERRLKLKGMKSSLLIETMRRNVLDAMLRCEDCDICFDPCTKGVDISKLMEYNKPNIS